MPAISHGPDRNAVAENARPACRGVDRGEEAWFAVYTAPRHEKLVHRHLIAKQIRSFLPLYTNKRRWKNGVQREIQHPLIPGYVFVRIDPAERLPVMQTAGVVYIVGNGSSLLPFEDQEMNALRIGAQQGSLMPHAFVSAGDRVSITRGPFQGVKGFVEEGGTNVAFVITIQPIQSSFAVSVPATDLERAG